MKPFILPFALVFVAWLLYKTKSSTNQSKAKTDAFWERERLANTTRKKDLSNLDYITVPIKSLPFPETGVEEIDDIQKHIKHLSTGKIVNFTGMSNTDLKLQYGAPNITFLMEYDKNYLELVRSLYRYGKLLYDTGLKDDAAVILEYGLTVGTDVSANYTLLATIYKEKNENNRIDFVISKAEELTSMTKKALLNSLVAIRDSSVSS